MPKIDGKRMNCTNIAHKNYIRTIMVLSKPELYSSEDIRGVDCLLKDHL